MYNIVWWIGSCGHEWKAHIHNRTKPKNPTGCPYCANKYVDDTNSLESKFPEIAEEWHKTKNGNLNPKKIVWCSYKKVWWLGKCGHEWETLIRTRTRTIRPAGCPVCKNSKGEQRVEKFLIENGIEYKKQTRFYDCRDKYPLPFDFEIKNQNILIEYQGRQHYEPINFGGDYLQIFTDLQRHDKIKKDWCESKCYKLIQIKYDEFDSIEEILAREVYHSKQDTRRS